MQIKKSSMENILKHKFKYLHSSSSGLTIYFVTRRFHYNGIIFSYHNFVSFYDFTANKDKFKNLAYEGEKNC